MNVLAAAAEKKTGYSYICCNSSEKTQIYLGSNNSIWKKARRETKRLKNTGNNHRDKYE